MIIANRSMGREGCIFVMTGDGELQEDQFWESLISAANDKLDEITVIIDHNKLQSDTFVSSVSDLGNLEAKLSVFGWHVERVNGHDFKAIALVFDKLRKIFGKPKMIIADTVKGRGVSFMEHTPLESINAMYPYHSGAPEPEAYFEAVQELLNTINVQLDNLETTSLKLESVEISKATKISSTVQRLIPAYSAALVEQANKHSNLVALDADLALDTGLLPLRNRFPGRFVECGVA